MLFLLLSFLFVAAGFYLINDERQSRISKATSLASQLKNSLELFSAERRQAMISLMQTWPAFSPNEIDWFNVQAVSLMNIQHGYTSLSVTDRSGKIRWMTIPEGQGSEAVGFAKPERKESPLRLPSLHLSDDFQSMLVRSQTSGHYFLVYARAISTQEPELGFLVATFDVSEILDAMVGELVGPQFNFMIRDIDAHLLEAGDFADDGSIVETGNIAFLGRNWSLQIQSRPARFDAGWLLGAAGVLMSLLVSWIFHKQLKGAVRLSVSQKRYQIASEAGLDALMIYQPASGGFVLLEANTVSYELFPSLKNRQLPHTLHYLMAFLGHPELTTAAKKVSDSGVPYETYVKVDTDATAAGWLKIQMVKAGETLALTMRDVSERFRAQIDLKKSEERYRRLLDNMQRHFVYTRTPDHRFVFVSAGLSAITGLSADEFCEQSASLTYRVPDNIHAITDAIAKGVKPEPYLVHYQGKDGEIFVIEFTDTPVCDDNGKLIAVEGIARDVTKEQALQEEVVFQASHDQLTGLVNRYAFDNELHVLLESVKRGEQTGVMCFIDMDRFKLVNDSCGHPAGDRLLKEVAGIFARHLTENELLARIGGDEFCIIFSNQTLKAVTAKLDEIIRAVSEYRFIYEDRLFYVGASIGVISIDQNSGSAAELIQAADNACYQAKYQGRNRYVVHQPDGCGSGLNKESSVLHALQRAIQHGLFELHSQSIVPMHKEEQALEHYEILLRLPDGNGGLISPALFIPLAERHGLMNQVDGWVVDRTLSVLEAHPAHLERLGKVAINLSGLTLGDPSRLAGIVDRVMRSTVPAHKICFEITETAAVTNINAARHFIETLRSKGCLFALDDFGAGMSSFTYLKNLEVDFVKIDGSFVKNMARDSIDHETVKAISAIAQSMGKKTIAEFVTDQATCDALRELNVDYGQGFALGKPLPLMNRLHTRDNVNLLRA